MVGWSCLQCGERTFRRPPNNICQGCRSSRRGRQFLKVTKRFSKKGRPRSRRELAENEGSEAAHPVTANPGPDHQQQGEHPQHSAVSTNQNQDSVTPASSSSSSSSDVFSVLREGLQTTWQPRLLELFGFGRAHVILGQAGMMLEKMQQAKLKDVFCCVGPPFLCHSSDWPS